MQRLSDPDVVAIRIRRREGIKMRFRPAGTSHCSLTAEEVRAPALARSRLETRDAEAQPPGWTPRPSAAPAVRFLRPRS